MTEETVISGGMNSPDEDLSILIADASMPIAIVGMGFRGPGEARDINELWETILEKKEAWTPIPAARWNNKAFYHPDHARHGTINVEGGHFLDEDVSLFDAPFFNMTSDEAAAMDPQQRLLLEVTYEGLENAGIPLPQFMGSKTSCFVGSFSADYTDLLLRDPECVPMYQCTNAGQSRAMTANRVSYFFDLKGPSVTVDTACSGSLVALHLACQSLRTRDASMAIAAGVNLILSHEFMSTMSMMRFLSPDGRCYTFDEKANGYARGEAIGSLILKPLADALRDGNTIRAIIRGTGSNQDGRTPGITLPSGTAQETLIRDVYARAGLDPGETEVVETHGTGTQAGDPIETGAISRVFGTTRSSDSPVRIGSIKTNVGHLEGTSGVAGVIKAMLMLENRMMLPSRNFHTPNPRIPFDEWNLKVQTVPEPWVTAGPHRVSVNSFGYGGSNAHVILEDALGYLSARGIPALSRVPSRPTHRRYLELANHARGQGERYHIFMVSGFDEASCHAQIKSLRKYLQERQWTANEEFIGDLAFTLNERRSSFMWKAAIVGKSVTDLIASLSSGFKVRSSIRRPTLSFVFTGQGAQWPGMGKELLCAYPVFRESVTKIDHCLAADGAQFSVHEELSNGAEDSQLSHPLLSQTICTALQIALVDLLASWGIRPESVTGHSSGEIAAAYACGALNMEDAMAVAYYRGVAASQLLMTEARGSMMAIGMSSEEVQPYLERLTSGKAVVACVNSPSSVTVSGDAEAINELSRALKDTAVFSRRLAVDVAYHSHHMELVAREYRAAIEHVRPHDHRRVLDDAPQVSFFSSVTGKALQPSELGPQYWVSNLLGQVKFAESLKTLCFETSTRRTTTGLPNGRRTRQIGAAQKANVDCVLEIGPHSALAGPVKQILEADVKLKAADIVYASVLSRRSNAVTSVLAAMSTLASLNYAIDFAAINFPSKHQDRRAPRLLVDLPPYSWNHSRSYWAEPRLSKMFRNREYPRHDLLGAPDNMTCPSEPRWRNYLRISETPWLADHKIQSDIVFPAAGYLSIVVEAVMQLARNTRDLQEVVLQNISVQAALIIPETTGIEILTSLQQLEEDVSNGRYRFRIYSVSQDNYWTEHCTGIVGIEAAHERHMESACGCDSLIKVQPDAEPGDLTVMDVDSLYEDLRRIGLEYGPCFANISSAHATGTGVCLAEVTIPDTAAAMPTNFEHPLMVNPCTLDSTFHTIFAALPRELLERGPLIPVSIESMRISCQFSSVAGDVLSICTDARSTATGGVLASITTAGSRDSFGNSEPKLSISGLRCTRLEIAPTGVTKQKDVPIAHGIAWRPDPDLLFARSGIWSRYMGQHTGRVEDLPSKNILDDHTVNAIQDALSRFERQKTGQSDFAKQYKADLEELFQRQHNRHRLPNHNGTAKSKSAGLPVPYERLFHILNDHLSAILRNDKSHEETEGDLWTAYWEVLSQTRAYRSAAQYIDLGGYRKPDISVLDVNHGPQYPYSGFLKCLAGDGANGSEETPRCVRYTFAYPDNLQIELAKKKLTSWPDLVDFMKLDIEGVAAGHGSSQASYDIIILHGLNWAQTGTNALANIKTLLSQPGSIIILPYLDKRQGLLDVVMFHDLHPEPTGRLDIPGNDTIQASDLRRMVDEAGLTAWGPGESRSQEDPLADFLVCRPNQVEHLAKKDIVIIDENGHNATAAEFLRNRLLACSSTVTITDISRAQPEGKVCVVLSDPQEYLLANLDDSSLQKLKEIFLRSAGVLWITKGGVIEPTSPEAGLAFGFARTARSESSVRPIVTLDLDAVNPLPEHQVADLLFGFIRHRFLQQDLPNDDVEYAERDGMLLIPRVIDRPDLNRDIERAKKPDVETEQPFRSESEPLRLVRANAAKQQLHFTADTRMTHIPAGFVGIEVMAFGLSEYETQPDMLQNEAGDTLSLECSGVVYAVGSGVHDLVAGDRVVCLGAETARTLYHGHSSEFQKIKGPISYELAAAVPVAYSTVYHIVHELARVEARDAVLIYDAATWFGQAVVEICILTGAALFTMVRTSPQKELLLDRFKLPHESILITDKDNSTDSLGDFMRDKTADVVIGLDEHGNESLQFPWQHVAPFGRLIQVSTHNSATSRRCEIPSPSKNVSFSTFNVWEFQKQKKDLARTAFAKVVRLFNDGELRGPAHFPVHGVGDIEQADDFLRSEQHVVITAGTNPVVKAILPNTRQDLFHDDASYLLIGGLGGIGRAIALWMADHGARHLTLVNRSGLSTESGKSTVAGLQAKGVCVTVQACDISDEGEVNKMILDIQRQRPPIRGVIQGAMVLKDIHIERMTAEDYNTVLQPRYNGSWNLHKHLQSDLDFFVMLSSISGVIGNATQAAYAAGSAFMDTFAAYRNTLGLPAVSLDLGTITDVGYLASNKELLARMERQGFQGTDTQTLLSLVQVAIAQPRMPGQSQIITGLGEWKEGESLGNFDDPLFSHFRRRFRTRAQGAQSDDRIDQLHRSLDAVKTQEDAIPIVFEALSGKIATQLGISIDRVDPSSPLSEFGVDSHVAVELRDWISKVMESSVSILEILASTSMLQLAGQIAGRSRLVHVDSGVI